MYSPYFFFFFGGGGWGGDLKTDHEAMIIYLLAGFFGSKSQSTFLIFNPSLERLFSAFWKKKGWGGGEGIEKNSLCDKALFHVKSYK